MYGFYRGKKRKLRGENIGEASVRKLLTNYCRKNTAHLLNNVTLEYRGGTTQIDHILITLNGILVIETKHYSGWIFGEENAKYWTQTFYKSKHQFQNPLRQNYKHLLALREIIETLPNNAFFSSVVFTGKAEFKTLVPENIFTPEQLIQKIKESKDIIDTEQMMICIGKIEHARYEMTKETDIEHLNYLTKKFGDKPKRSPKQKKTKSNSSETQVVEIKTPCVKCGNDGSKKDKNFWTCVVYPECKTAQV